jgi:glucosylceramidase
LLSTAYINPDGKIAVVVMNPTDNKITYYLSVGEKGSELNSLPHSIATLVF